MNDQYANEEEREGKKVGGGGGTAGFYGWTSSRIVRVSRASGGKDRHSKVLTSKGLRDRRVRLSVNTAIQFYDLQDRLGYDQPSKAMEWLLKATASSIAELPPMNSLFPKTPKRLCAEKRSRTSNQLGIDLVEMGTGVGGGNSKYPHGQQVTKSSNCSSTSETSRGSGLSLSRYESRIKARERAKERVAEKEKEKESESSQVASLNPISHTASFTELLSAGMDCNGSVVHPDSNPVRVNQSNFFEKSSRLWPSAPMDYFGSGFFVPSATRPGRIHFANSTGDNQPEIQQFSFVPDHLAPVINAAAGAGGNTNSNSNHQHNAGGNEYNLNFTISSSSNSSGLVGFNGGTLQSNSSSSSLLPYNHLQRFPLMDGSSPNIFIGTAPPVENQNQFLSGFNDRRRQISYGDANANTGQKGNGKN